MAKTSQHRVVVFTHGQGRCSMPPALAEKVAQIQSLYDSREPQDLRIRYRVGCLVQQVRDGSANTYGQKAVETIAQFLEGRSDANAKKLYASAAVADAWPEKEFEEWIERSQTEAGSLKWTHFTELSPKTISPAKRRQWLLCCLRHRWSIHQLRMAIRQERQAASESEARQLARYARRLRRLAAQTRGASEEFRQVMNRPTIALDAKNQAVVKQALVECALFGKWLNKHGASLIDATGKDASN